MHCSDVIRELVAFRHGELTSELSQSVEGHLRKCSACQKVYDDIAEMEQRMVIESELWQQPTSAMQPITLEQLRRRAASLPDDDGETLARGTHPFRLQVVPIKLHQWSLRRWIKPLISLIAVCLVLILVAPQVIMAAVDLPGIGPWLQKMALQRVGLEWAVENGYVQGTVAQISANGITLRVIGVVADPVQTSVIYLVQGLERPQEQAVEQRAEKLERTNTERSPIPDTELPQIRIKSVDGQGTSSWLQRPTWTTLGLVGVVETHPLPNEQGTIEMELIPHKNPTERLALTLPLSRAAESKLATINPLEYEKTADDITVRGERVILTPMQIRIEYSVAGGHGVNGSIPTEYAPYLASADGQRTTGHGGASLIDGVWKYRWIADRPSNLADLTMVIPWLSKDIPIDLSWSFDGEKTVRSVLGIPLELKTRYVKLGQVSFELLWPRSVKVWGFGGLEVYDTEGRLMDFNEQWSEVSDIDVHGFRTSEPRTPDRLRITTLEQVVNGQWEIPIPPIR